MDNPSHRLSCGKVDIAKQTASDSMRNNKQLCNLNDPYQLSKINSTYEENNHF